MRRIFLLFVWGSVSLLFGAGADIMPLHEVKPGMRGTGLTVFEQGQLESFDVEIIDIIRNVFPQRDLILIKLLGERVSHTGVVSGMSGSPIYIEEKLIGALAYSMGNFMKDPIAGVTPIEQMLEIFAREQTRSQEISAATSPGSSKLIQLPATYSLEKFDLFQLLPSQPTTNWVGAKPIETPLVVSGLSPSLHHIMSHHFSNSNFILYPGGGLDRAEITDRETIMPGSAIAAVVVSGDFDVSAVGTVTYRDGEKILAFGHPFIETGPVNIPLAEARIVTTLSSLYASRKFTVAREIIGTIRQDRSSGILALIGEIPPMIPVNVKVNSPIGVEKKFRFQLANDRSMAGMVPVFLWITLINTLESARSGGGDYALRLKGRIDLEASPSVIFDDFYAGGGTGFFDGSGSDMPEAAYDVAMTLASLLMNDFEAPKIRGIELEFAAQPGQRLAEIEQVIYDKTEVKPGDSLNIIIIVKPYRGKRMELTRQIYIPQNIMANRVILAVGGTEEITRWEYQAGIGKFAPANLNELVTLLNQKRKTGNITIQLKVMDSGAMLHGREFPTLPPSVFEVMKNNKTDKSYEMVTEKIIQEWSVPLEFVVKGGRKISLAIRPH